MKKTIFTLLALVASAHCQAQDPTLSCLDAVAKDSRFDKIATKIVLPLGEQPSMQMMADHSKATSTERPVISAWADASDKCFKEGVDYRKENYGEDVAALMEKSIFSFKQLVADLYSGQSTYGDFNQMRWTQAQQDNKAIAALNKQAAAAEEQERAANEESARVAWQETVRRQTEAADAASQATQERTNAILSVISNGLQAWCASKHPGRC